MRHLTLILLCMSFAASNLNASDSVYETGHDLLKYSTLYIRDIEGEALTSTESMAAVTFHTYIEGFLGGIRMSQVLAQKEFISLPNNPSHEQYARVINNYLKNNPEKLHESARALMIISLSQAFPKKD